MFRKPEFSNNTSLSLSLFQILALFFCFCFSVPLQAEVQAKEKVVLQLKWFHQFQFAGYYAAKAQGYYADAGLEVEIREYEPGLDVTRHVVSGEAQYGIGDSSLIQGYANGDPIVALAAIFQHDPLLFFSLRSSGIVSPYELHGKRIMFSYPDAALRALLLEADIGSDDFIHQQHSYDFNDLINGKTDAIAGYQTTQLYFFQQLDIDVNMIKPLNYGVDFYGDILFTTEQELQQHPLRVKAFRDATLKGWNYALENPEQIIELIQSKYKSKLSLQHLRFEAEQTRKLILPDLIPVGTINPKRLIRSYQTYKNLGSARKINEQELEAFIYQDSSRFELSDDEKNWLDQHPEIRVGIDRDFAPFEWVDSNGTYQGVVADYILLLEEKLGVEFKVIKNKSWAETLGMAQRGEVDMLSDANFTHQRSAYLDFTEPYLNSPIVIISDSRKGYIGHLRNLYGKRVAIETGYFMQDILARDHPEIQMIETENEISGLQLVNEGLADAYIGDGISLNYFIQQQGLLNLRHSGSTGYSSQHSMAVTHHNPLLLSILEKTLASIPDDQKQAMQNRWMSLLIEKGISRQALLGYIAATLVFFSLLVFYIFKIRSSERARAESENRLNEILSNINVYVYLKDLEGRYTYANQKVCEFWNTSAENIIGKSDEYFFDEKVSESIRMGDIKVLENGKAVTSYETINSTDTDQGKTYLTTKLPLSDINGNTYAVLGVSTDVTDNIRSELRDKGRNLVLEMLARDYDLKEVLEQLITNFENDSPHLIGSILLLSEDGSTLAPFVSPSLPPAFIQVLDGIAVGPEAGCCGAAVSSGKRVIAEDLQTHPFWKNYKQLVLKAKLGSCWSEPVRSSNGKVIGTLAVYTKSRHVPDKQELNEVTQLANLAGIAIEKSRFNEALLEQQKLLEESNRQLKYVLNATSEGVWDWDLKTNQIQHNQQWSNIMKVVNHTPSDTYDEFIKRVVEEDREQVARTAQQSIENNTLYFTEHRLVRDDGEIIWVLSRGQAVEWDEAGKATRMVGATEDITARKKFESDIIEKEQLLRSSIDTIGEGFVIFDPDDKLVYFNEQYKSLIEDTADYITIGKTYRDILENNCNQGLYPEAAGRENEWIDQRLALHHQESSEGIQELSGNRWLKIRERKTPNGYIVGFRVDITELVQARQEADEASHTKSRFLATMSHEIRTPMNAVLGMSQLLEDTALDTTQQSYLKVINDSGKGLLTIINDILDFSKLEADMVQLNIESFDLYQICWESIESVSSIAKSKGLNIKFENSISKPTLYLGDPGRLKQVILNLLNNAIKFTQQGEVKLTLIISKTDENTHQIDLVVSDSGVGIEQHDLKYLFDEFTQADETVNRNYGGTGLGLSISHKIIDLMQGSIRVSSQPGQGSEFTVTIPLKVNMAQTSDKPKVHKISPVDQSIDAHILLVEDVAPNQIIAKKFLTGFGCKVDVANDGKEALSSWENNNYDLVLMDCRMPVMDGYEATSRIREIEADQGVTQSVPVIALTANATVEDRKQCLDVGMNDVITKPFERADLFQVIKHWLAESRPNP